MKIFWTLEAEFDRNEIWNYLLAENPAAAARMDRLFVKSIKNLVEFPLKGKVSLLEGMREVIPHPSYKLIYEAKPDRIIFHAIVHTSRQWPPLAK